MDNSFVVKPTLNFWTLPGSLASEVELDDEQLAEARLAFGEDWSQRFSDC